ncbi:hypothetical protein [Faecalibacillus intestinalis]|jgi:hypothetical protein|uniref:hypothetical protein n=1 Tax=Faecalibacillus intestinalis TaxID=1982626 RepID=UPI0022E37BC7|nr:hypothetical protein [Faecalibacillus intestinalis]
MTDFEYRLLKNNGFNDRDIKFIIAYSGEDYLNKIIKKLKRINALETKKAQQESYKKRLENDKLYKYQSQCKCVVGYIIIQKLIEQSIINGYEDILSNGNELSEKMQDIMKNILIYIENNVKT